MNYNFNFSGERLFFLIVFNLGVGSSIQYISNSFLLFIMAVIGNIAIVNVNFKKKKVEEKGVDQINVNIPKGDGQDEASLS